MKRRMKVARRSPRKWRRREKNPFTRNGNKGLTCPFRRREKWRTAKPSSRAREQTNLGRPWRNLDSDMVKTCWRDRTQGVTRPCWRTSRINSKRRCRKLRRIQRSQPARAEASPTRPWWRSRQAQDQPEARWLWKAVANEH
jgi:hypothetical protein